jgi:hypothetical protein
MPSVSFTPAGLLSLDLGPCASGHLTEQPHGAAPEGRPATGSSSPRSMAASLALPPERAAWPTPLTSCVTWPAIGADLLAEPAGIMGGCWSGTAERQTGDHVVAVGLLIMDGADHNRLASGLRWGGSVPWRHGNSGCSGRVIGSELGQYPLKLRSFSPLPGG